MALPPSIVIKTMLETYFSCPINRVTNAMFNYIRNLGSSARNSSNRSSQPNRQNAAPRDSLYSDDSFIYANPPPYCPRSATSRDSITRSQDSVSSLGNEALRYLHEHNNIHYTPTQHHGESSTETNLPSLNRESACSNTMCTCTPLQGCCSDHNSLQTPNPAPFELLGAACNVFRNMPNTSSFTLTPIHQSIRYYLSMSNLNCISRRLNSEIETTFIPELSLEGSACSAQETQYEWSNEIYFHNGRFLQKQEIHTAFYKNHESSPEHFIGCPHQNLTVHTPHFGIRDGMCEAEAWVTSIPPRCSSHPMQKWNNFQGPYTHITSCTICHSDTECYIQLNGAFLDIRYTCYRDLGAGLDPNDPKWRALLTGTGVNHRPQYEFEVLKRVWLTARQLERRGLEEVTQHTPNGVFHVRSQERDEA